MGGSTDSKSGAGDENSVMFVKSQQADFERLKAEVEERMARFRHARLGVAQPVAPQADIAGQIKKLADLRDAGILTEEEFSSNKAELLQRL